MNLVNCPNMGSARLFLCAKDRHVPGILFQLEIPIRKHVESLTPVYKDFGQAIFFFYGDFMPGQ